MAKTTSVDEHYGQVLDEKRRAILNHVIGKHHHPENNLYIQCTHPPNPTSKDGQVRQRMDIGK